MRRPKRVGALQGKKVVAIATGSLHCVACTDTGEVFTWGDNDEGQLGDGTTSAIQRPRLVTALQVNSHTHAHTDLEDTFSILRVEQYKVFVINRESVDSITHTHTHTHTLNLSSVSRELEEIFYSPWTNKLVGMPWVFKAR